MVHGFVLKAKTNQYNNLYTCEYQPKNFERFFDNTDLKRIIFEQSLKFNNQLFQNSNLYFLYSSTTKDFCGKREIKLGKTRNSGRLTLAYIYAFMQVPILQRSSFLKRKTQQTSSTLLYHSSYY